MANIKLILNENVINGYIQKGFTIEQLNMIAQMAFDEMHGFSESPPQMFSSIEAGINHIKQHGVTINGKDISGMSEHDLDLELLSKRVTVHDTNNRKIFRGYGFFSYVDVYPEGEVNPFITELVIKNLLVNSDGILKVPEHEVKPHMWYIKEVGDILVMIFQYMGSSSETA